MSELTKTKVIDIQTGQAVKNVDNLTSSFVPLKKQIRDLMNELTQLEQGTEQYNKVAQQLADLQQRQREAAEAAKYSSKDFGEVMSNLTKVSLGVAGGINAISASMALLGGDSEKMQKALAPIQMMMAVIQGVSAIDTAIKSLKGLNNMFESLGSTSEKAAEQVAELETGIDSIGDKKVSVDVDTTKAEESVEGLETDIDSIGDKDITVDADTTKARESVSELTTDIDSIGDKDITVDADTTKAEESVSGLASEIDSIGDKEITVGVDTRKADKSVSNLDRTITKTTKDRKVRIDADTKKADTNVKSLEKEINGVGGKTVDVGVDTTEATTKVEELKTEIETIPDRDIVINADTESVVESVEEVTESLDDMADIDIEVKAEGLDNVTKEVKSLGEAEKNLATNTQTAATATNTLNTATKSTAASTTAMATGAKTAAVATTTLAAGEGVATKASWTLTGALKTVGTAIKSIPVIGWIAMGVTLLTSLIRLIVSANKESKEGEEIARKIAMAEQDRLDTLYEIERKYAKISEEMQKSINRLQLLPKGSREYNEELEKIAKQWVVSKEYAEAHLDKLKKNAKTLEDYKTTTDKIAANYKYYDEQMAKKEKLERSVTTAVKAQADTTKAILDELKEGTKDGIKITKDQSDEIEKIQKRLVKGKIDATQAEEEAKKVVKSTTDAYWDQANAAKQANINKMNGLEKQNANQKLVIAGIQTESDAYDEMLKKQKEGREAAKEARRKYEEAQKSYIQALEDMKIADAEYNGDWNRYADERKKKAERVYNDDLKTYKQQLKGKLISQQQYDEILKAREEQYNNEVAQIQLDTNKKMWEQELKDSLDAIEKEKQAKIKAANETYIAETKNGVSTATDTRAIANEQAELDAIRKTNDALKQRLQIVEQNKDESQEYADYVKSLQDQIAANEQKAAELELQIDEDSYNKRKKQAEDYYNSIGQMAADKTNQAIIDNNGHGNNLFVEQQKIELQAIRDKMDALKQAYEEGLITEAEYHSRSLELQADYVMKSKEYEEQHQQSILQTASTYVQTVQMLGSAISSILDQVMSQYDENSEEYKKMAVANAVIQTISGQLGAFMSGVNSGVPAPWNFLLGGVLATATLATGLIGIAHIKSGNIGGDLGQNASNVGRGEYETTAYAQQTEMMGTVTDQRVYVLESDISSAQNNVSVMEADNTF